MPRLPITLEEITYAVDQGFRAGLDAAGLIEQTVCINEEEDAQFLLRKSRDVTSKVIQAITNRSTYVQDPHNDAVYWANRDGDLVYFNTEFGELDCPPPDISNWMTTLPGCGFRATPERVVMWAKLLDIIPKD